MKHFDKYMWLKKRTSQKERGQYAVMKRNQRKALRRKFHVEDSVLISNL
jgi:hypothetical protein